VLKNKKLIYGIVIFFILIIAVFIWNSSVETSEYTSTNVPVHIAVNIDRAPRINETANVRWNVSSDEEMPQVNAFLELPSGVQLVSGIVDWQGSLSAGDSKQLLATIKVVKEGILGIQAVVRTEPDENGDSWSDVDYVYLTVTASESKIGLPTEGGKIETRQETEQIP
jgi:hypothetical protein